MTTNLSILTDVIQKVKRLTRSEQQQRTRLALLDAAIELFIEQGIDATTIEDVVGAAGFTRGAFYSNFDSKEDLFVEATRHFFEDVLYSYSTTLEGEDVAAAGRSSFDALRNVVDNRGSIYIAEATLYAHRHPSVRESCIEMSEGALQRTMGWVQAAMTTFGIDKPALPIRDLASITQAVTFGLQLKEILDPSLDAAAALGGLLSLVVAAHQVTPTPRSRQAKR